MEKRDVVLVVEGDDLERMQALDAIEKRTMGSWGCCAAVNPAEGILKLHTKIQLNIVGVLCALRFPGLKGVEDILRLSQECKVLGKPFLLCISIENDNLDPDEMELLQKNGLDWVVVSEGFKNWGSAVGKFMKKA